MAKTIKAIQIFKSKTTNVGKNPLTSPDDFELVGVAPSQLPSFEGSGGNASSVSYDDTQTKLGVTNVQQAIETIVNDKIPDVYDYSGTETLTNKIAKVDGVEYQVYRTSFEVDYQFIADSAQHFVRVFNKSGIRFHNSYIEVMSINNAGGVIPFTNDKNVFRILISGYNFSIAYVTNNSNFNRYKGFIEYIKL